MSKDEAIERARLVVGGDPMASHLGIAVEEVSRGRAVVSLVPEARHTNAVGRVHGSAIYALVDQACAVAANSLGGSALIFEAKVNFLAGAAPGERLLATAQALDLKRTLSLWEVRVTDPQGNLVALGQVMAYHKPSASPSASAPIYGSR